MNFEDYQKYMEQHPKKENGNGGNGNFQKVGFFKLANDGDMALVRFCVDSLKDIDTEPVHQAQPADIQGIPGKWPKIKCLNELGSFDKVCPICAAIEQGDTTFSKVSRKCYIKMLVAYKNADGSFGAPQPVIWERGSSLGTELGRKLAIYGSLKESLFLVIRNGKAGNKETSYQIEPAPVKVYPETLIPADFSAFENFRIDKHSFWIKTVDEIKTFYTTGAFPAPVAENTTAEANTVTPQATQTQVQTAQVQTTQPAAPTYEQAEANPYVQPTAQPTAQPTDVTPAANNERPQGRFTFL